MSPRGGNPFCDKPVRDLSSFFQREGEGPERLKSGRLISGSHPLALQVYSFPYLKEKKTQKREGVQLKGDVGKRGTAHNSRIEGRKEILARVAKLQNARYPSLLKLKRRVA